MTRVDALTGFPEMLSGRVKTLHPAVHGGILAIRDDASHMSAISAAGITPIDIVVVNLYPFRETVTNEAKPATFEVGVENIDIGGPAMIRAAAKNHAAVSVCVDPADYPSLLESLGKGGDGGAEGLALRARLAWKAFAHTACYDATVAEWLWGQVGDASTSSAAGVAPPPAMAVPLTLAAPLRYGENPHQAAAFYTDDSLAEAGKGGVARAVQHHGKEVRMREMERGMDMERESTRIDTPLFRSLFPSLDVLQQLPGRGRGVRDRLRPGRPGLRDRQAHQPVRRGRA